MPRGLDKVEAGVDAIVYELCPVDAVLLLEIGVEASLNVLQDWVPALRVVDKVAKPGCIYDGEL